MTAPFASNLEALCAFKTITNGAYLRLRPFEMVLEIVQPTPDRVVVKILTFDFAEQKTETYLNGRGTKLVGYRLDTVRGWLQDGKAITIWDTDFERTAVNHYQAGKTEAEWHAARAYARQCYRPGSDVQPMDSFRRTAKGYTPARMARHW